MAGNFDLFEDAASAPKVLIYGDSGIGKTELSTYIARVFKVIVVDLDNSLESWRKLPQEFHKNITYVRVVEDVAAPKAHETVNKILGANGILKLCQDHGRATCLDCTRARRPFFTINFAEYSADDTVIIVDNITRYSDSHFAAATANVDLEGVGKGYKPEFDHWGSLANRMANFQNLVQYCRLPVCALAHTVTITEGAAAKAYPTGGSRKTAASLSRVYDTVIYMSKAGASILATSSAEKSLMSVAKSRADIDVDINNPETLLDCFRKPSQRVVFTPAVTAEIVKTRQAKAAEKLKAKVATISANLKK